MKQKRHSASAVKFSFWFPEFRKVIGLLAEGKAQEEIKKLRQGQRGFFSVISSFKMNWIRLGGISMTV
ncbi:MAG: BrxA family protein [Sphaerochaetaceae bacterium]|jgi:hypothetical protein